MSSNYFSLASGSFSQDWSNANLITTDDDWSNVPSIVGYRGDDVITATGVDPRTITSATGPAAVIDVTANQTNPNTFNTGGVAEFAITNPTIALQGSGTADAPSIVIYLDATGRENIRFQANLRDIDGSTDNAAQPIAVQYRVAGGAWTNAFYTADASTGPSLATAVTAVDITLGADANNSPTLEIRVITTNSVGNDEWIGIDDIVVSSTGAAADTTAPTLAAFNPADPDDGAVAVDPTGNIVLRFNEAVHGVSGNIVISNGAGDTRTIAITDATQVSFSGSQLTINPTADLIAGSTYAVTIGSGVIADTAGNAFAGLPANALDFTTANPATVLTIGTVQGLGHTSPYVGTTVRVEGVVTAIDTNGYYLQSAAGATDGDVRTSDAILVFTVGAPTGITIGELLRVDGTVTEFRPGGATGANNLTTTELTGSTIVAHLGTASIETTVIGAGGRVPPTEVIDNDNFATYDPAQDGIDFYESLEGMKVTIDAPRVVSGPNALGEIFVFASNGVGATGLSEHGTLTISPGDYNPERIQLDDDSGLFTGFNAQLLSLGDRLANVTGIVGYSFGNYEVLVTEAVTITQDVTIVSDITSVLSASNRLTLADYNLENIDPTDPQAKFDALAFDIVNNLKAPDILGVQEIQDADGAGSGANLSGAATANKLIAAIIAAGGPTYTYVEVAPTTANSTGGEPGGNIRNGYFYNDDRVDYVTGSAVLVPGAAFNGSRNPLAAQFVFNGQTITAINLHSTSRGGSDSLFGNAQPPADAGDSARTAQAQAVRSYVDGLLAQNPSAKIVVQGDFNGFTYENAIGALTAGGALTDLNALLPAAERYSYVFDGNAQQIDHILASASLLNGAQFDAVHLNAELAQSLQIATDHDAVISSFLIPLPNSAPVAVNDSVTVAEDATSGNLAAQILGNDTDVDVGDTRTIISVGTTGTQGHVMFDAATQTLTYAADADAFDPLGVGQSATDSFTYTIRDAGGLTSTATVTVNVTGVDNDGIIGTPDKDTLNGTSNADRIFGLGGDDTLNGLAGNDTLDGGDGNDTVNGGLGADTMTGGAGNDRFTFRPGEVQGDVITDFDGKGTAVGDTLAFTGFGRGAFLTHEGNQWTIHYGANVETFTLNVSSLATNDVILG